MTYFGTEVATGNAADLADPDNDGVPNLLEYALGSLPNNSSVHNTPVTATTAISGHDYLTLNVPWNSSATDVTFAVEVSDDLITWNSGPAYTTVVSSGPNLVVRDNTPMTAAAKRFMRLRVTH